MIDVFVCLWNRVKRLRGIMWETQVACETTLRHFFKTCMIWDRWPTLQSISLPNLAHQKLKIHVILNGKLVDSTRATLHIWLKSPVPMVRCLLRPSDCSSNYIIFSLVVQRVVQRIVKVVFIPLWGMYRCNIPKLYWFFLQLSSIVMPTQTETANTNAYWQV